MNKVMNKARKSRLENFALSLFGLSELGLSYLPAFKHRSYGDAVMQYKCSKKSDQGDNGFAISINILI